MAAGAPRDKPPHDARRQDSVPREMAGTALRPGHLGGGDRGDIRPETGHRILHGRRVSRRFFCKRNLKICVSCFCAGLEGGLLRQRQENEEEQGPQEQDARTHG